MQQALHNNLIIELFMNSFFKVNVGLIILKNLFKQKIILE